MSDKRDYYQVLGLPPTAAEHEIKSAFRRLAKEYHPDRNPGPAAAAAEASFKEVNEAYPFLSHSINHSFSLAAFKMLLKLRL